MGITDLVPSGGVLSTGLGKFLKYAWIFFPVVFIILIVGGIILYRMYNKKSDQWTHKLRIRRVLKNNLLSKDYFINMRRNPLIKKAEIFELEKPLLGGYLIPELDQYSGENEYSIILGKDNRIYINKGEYFNPDKSCAMVSAKHAEIDIQRANLKADFQKINATSKRVEWGTIAKYAFMIMLITCLTLVAIVSVSKWGEAQVEQAKAAQAEAQAMENLGKAMTTVEATVNTQKLEILPLLQEIYKTKNIQSVINTPIIINETT